MPLVSAALRHVVHVGDVRLLLYAGMSVWHSGILKNTWHYVSAAGNELRLAYGGLGGDGLSTPEWGQVPLWW